MNQGEEVIERPVEGGFVRMKVAYRWRMAVGPCLATMPSRESCFRCRVALAGRQPAKR